MAEETGSPGLREFCRENRQLLKADLFIASDGPRVSAATPTVFLGSRGLMNIRLRLTLHDGNHHSGNWGGALANPAVVLANALATIVDGRGRVLAPGLLPTPIPDNVRLAIAECPVGGDPGDPDIDPDLGRARPDAKRARVWLEHVRNSRSDAQAIPRSPQMPFRQKPSPSARSDSLSAATGGTSSRPSRRDLKKTATVRSPSARCGTRSWCRHASIPTTRASNGRSDSIERSLGKRPVVLPNLGGGLPNDIFANDLGLPTLWIPHSYPGCRQHGPDEHTLLPILGEGLAMMTGLLWDMGSE